MRLLALLLLSSAAAALSGCRAAGGGDGTTARGAMTSAVKGEETEAVKRARELIEQLRRGGEYRRGADAFLTGGAPDAGALALLAEALATEVGPQREQLVRLLVAVGQEAEPLHRQGIPILRDRKVVALLIDEGLRVPGTARDYALDSMEAMVPRALLEEHGKALAEDLARRPGTSALLVVAKAKPPQAIPVVSALVASPSWAHVEEASIARAALGNASVEKTFADAFLAAHDPGEKAKLARALGRIGTWTALRTLASELRTPLVIEISHVMERSVRLDILAALCLSFPDKTFLYDNAIQDDEGYARVEAFLEQTFGITWKTPRPPFLTVRGFPHVSVE